MVVLLAVLIGILLGVLLARAGEPPHVDLFDTAGAPAPPSWTARPGAPIPGHGMLTRPAKVLGVSVTERLG